MKTLSLIPFLLAAMAISAQTDPDLELKAALKQAKASANAVVKEDFEKLADLTYPRVVDSMGGKEKMVEFLKKTIAEMKAKKFRFLGAKVDPPTKIFRAGAERMTVVPMSLDMQIPDGTKVRVRSFLVGVTKDGKKWTFVDGNVGEAKIREVVPNLPKEMKLPKAQKPEPIKDDE